AVAAAAGSGSQRRTTITRFDTVARRSLPKSLRQSNPTDSPQTQWGCCVLLAPWLGKHLGDVPMPASKRNLPFPSPRLEHLQLPVHIVSDETNRCRASVSHAARTNL